MFRMMRLRPPYGWPAFGWELLVVTLGVLIALIAEQTVSSWRRDAEVRSFRAAIDEELGINLAAYDFRLAQGACVATRLAELRRLRNQSLAGSRTAVMNEIGRPDVATIQTSVWSARDPEVVGAMPLDVRLAYSALYDLLVINYEQIAQEREAWRSMARFNGLASLNEDDVRRLNELLFRADSINKVLRRNQPAVLEKADELGIKASEDERRNLGAADRTLCRPVLTGTAERAG